MSEANLDGSGIHIEQPPSKWVQQIVQLDLRRWGHILHRALDQRFFVCFF